MATKRKMLKIRIGKTRIRELERTPRNIALLKAVYHFADTGRIDAKDVAKMASEVGGEKITKATAIKFLAFLFEPQSLEESMAMLEELTAKS